MYRWLEISEAESFPKEVEEGFTEECKAKYHVYAGGKQKCLHIVGPDLPPLDGKDFTLNQAMDKLTIAKPSPMPMYLKTSAGYGSLYQQTAFIANRQRHVQRSVQEKLTPDGHI